MAKDPNGELNCYELRKPEWESWDLFVNSSDTGSPYALSNYLSFLAELFGNTPRIIVAKNSDGFVCGVAFLESHSRFGISVINRLLMHYNGFVIGHRDEQTVTQGIAAILEFLSKRRYLNCIMHSRPNLAHYHPTIMPQWQYMNSDTYEVDLPTFNVENLSKNVRRLLRRATEHGLKFVLDGDTESCYALHRDTMIRKSREPYLTKEIFQRYVHGILERKLGSLSFVTTPEGMKVAMQLNLHCENLAAHTVLAGALAEWNRLGASVFLRISNFDYLRTRGYRLNDLTGAASENVARFKLDIGGVARNTCVYRQQPTLRARILKLLRR